MTGTIYKITSPSGKIYIGQTKRFKSRMTDHRNTRIDKGRSTLLGKSINKYGWDSHSVEKIVEIEYNSDLLNELEIHYIRLYNSFVEWNDNGMNLNTGGDVKTEISETTRAKLRLINKGRRNSDEAIERARQKKIGRKLTQDHKDKISKGTKGRKIVGAEYDKKASNLRAMSALARIPVNVYNKKMELLHTFESLLSASNELGIQVNTISKVCRGMKLYKSANDYVFRYKDGDQFPYVNKFDKTKLLQFDLNGVFINEFDSIQKAKIATGSKCLKDAIRGKSVVEYNGFIWKKGDHR